MQMDIRTAFTIRAAVPVLLLLCGGPVLFGCASVPSLRPYPTPERVPTGDHEGMRFPNLVFQDEHGRTHHLRDYRGRAVFLNFWASWCPPCSREMPAIQRLYDQLKGEEIVFVLLNANERFEVGRAWAQSNGFTMPLCNSKEAKPGYLPLVSGGTYRIPSIPQTYILDQNGIVVHWDMGENLYWDKWASSLRELIRASTPGQGGHTGRE